MNQVKIGHDNTSVALPIFCSAITASIILTAFMIYMRSDSNNAITRLSAIEAKNEKQDERLGTLDTSTAVIDSKLEYIKKAVDRIDAKIP